MGDVDKIREEAIRGPWLAVLADRYGFVYPSVEEARESAEDDEVYISVRRGSAAAMRDGGCYERLPGSYHCCDKAYEVEAYIDDPDDDSIGAEARYDVRPRLRVRRRERPVDRELSPREVEVLRLLAEGLSRRKVAERLFITVATVATHVAHLLPKLGANTTAHAVAIAIRAGLLDEDGCE